MTNYVILAKHPSSEQEMWVQFTAQVARTPRKAIEQALEGESNPYGSGTYIAVPARHWRPITVEVETKTALRFS